MGVLETRKLKPFLRSLGLLTIILGTSLLAVAVLLFFLGHDPLTSIHTLVLLPLTSIHILSVLVKFVPILLTGIAFLIPYQMRLFNLGAFGQMIVGASVITIVALELGPLSLPSVIVIPLLIILGFLVGGLWGIVPGVLRAQLSVNPIVSTIMMNYIALYLLNFVTMTEPWREPLGANPMTRILPGEAILPSFQGILHIGIIIAIVFFIAVYFFVHKTKAGYEIRAIGASEQTAKTFGIVIKRLIISVFFIAGGVAGVAGAIEVMGFHHYLIEGFAETGGAQFGMFGVLACLLAMGKPIYLPITALFLSTLLVGANLLQVGTKIPVELSFIVLAGMVLILIVIKMRKGK